MDSKSAPLFDKLSLLVGEKMAGLQCFDLIVVNFMIFQPLRKRRQLKKSEKAYIVSTLALLLKFIIV